MIDPGDLRGEAARARGSRVFLFALTDAGGTVPPEVGVVRRIVARGHQTTVLADESMADQVARTGATFVAWSQTASGDFRDWELRTPTSLARGMVDRMIAGPAAGHARDTATGIDEVRPDIVVASSLCYGAMIAAEARALPFDLLFPNAYPLPAKGMPPFGAGLAPAAGPLGRARDRLATVASSRLFDHYALDRINAVRADHGLAPIATTWDQQRHARRHLVLTSSAFDFPAELPDYVRYVGPILDDPAWAADEEWMPPPADRPLVLVAMSSTFQNHVECLQRIAEALGSLPVHGIVTTGPAVGPDEIRAPANVSVVASAPHHEVMRRASLVVTHGGHGTVIKALAAGLPLVVLHHGRDQADNAARVTTRGAGVAVSRRASSRRIARAIAQVIESSAYRSAAEKLGRTVRHDAEGGTVVTELEDVSSE